MPPKLFAVCGTRPDGIKMAPVILELNRSTDIQTLVIATGQHKQILQQVFDHFGVAAHENLDVMKHGQSLSEMTASILNGLDALIQKHSPQMIIAQGDTTTTFCAGLTAFYRRIPFAHVEAGLRTPTIDSPFPEEFNRRAVGLFAKLHFPPTSSAAENLLKEGAPNDSVLVTGNTSIDALLKVTAHLEPQPHTTERVILVTTHRRENWGDPQRAICRAIAQILDKVLDTRVILPMHPNPIVREVLEGAFKNNARVSLVEPPEYGEFAKLMRDAYLILTDSGGVQEEAPALGKPVLVLREETERPEGVAAGNALLVGADEQKIYNEAVRLLTDSNAYSAMAKARNPYGDGKAAQRIVARIRKTLGLSFEEISPFSG
ncbi:MAG: UDP-N-acetylglucosamine 2-epimerase (non-hydrolyzing) [Fimbriimonadales bacterium]